MSVLFAWARMQNEGSEFESFNDALAGKYITFNIFPLPFVQIAFHILTYPAQSPSSFSQSIPDPHSINEGAVKDFYDT